MTGEAAEWLHEKRGISMKTGFQRVKRYEKTVNN
jgi:hypothetical protein